MIEVSLDVSRSTCDAITDPFYIQDIDEDGGDPLAGNRFTFNLVDPDSNLEPDQLGLYLLIIILSMVQFTLIVRYFFRLQVYFDRLQSEI